MGNQEKKKEKNRSPLFRWSVLDSHTDQSCLDRDGSISSIISIILRALVYSRLAKRVCWESRRETYDAIKRMCLFLFLVCQTSGNGCTGERLFQICPRSVQRCSLVRRSRYLGECPYLSHLSPTCEFVSLGGFACPFPCIGGHVFCFGR